MPIARSRCYQHDVHFSVRVGADYSGEDLEDRLRPHVTIQSPAEVGDNEVGLRGHVNGDEEKEDAGRCDSTVGAGRR